MDDNYLWSPSDLNTRFKSYIDYLKINNLHNYIDYDSLHKWSIKNKSLFLLDLTPISTPYFGFILTNSFIELTLCFIKIILN